MPLLKRKPYLLSKPPENLKPRDLVFQVRFTKEIFKDYEEYLRRINLYRQRVWTCKYTGKGNLTYEEALESEHKATKKVQQFPKEFMGSVLKLVQFSMLRLDDLMSTILKFFRDHFVPGEEVLCMKENVPRPCRILQVIEGHSPESGTSNYEVGLLDDENRVTETKIESVGSLIRRKAPFTRALLKSFIRESVKDASRNSPTPLVVLDKLCNKYGLTTDPPEDLKKFFVKQEPYKKEENVALAQQSLVEGRALEIHVNKKQKKADTEQPENQLKKVKKKGDSDLETPLNKKQKKAATDMENSLNKKQKKIELEKTHEAGDDKSAKKTEPEVKVVPIKYPIEDTLLQPSSSDPPLPERPIPSSDFPLPSDCTGPLLMVWNFCSLFGKVIRLSPFSLEELEKALECKDLDPSLLREAHHALIKMVLDDPGLEQSFQEKRKRKAKTLTIQSWREDLSDILQLDGFEKLAVHSSLISKGDYRLLEPSVKLDILCHLVEFSLDSPAFREQLDVYIEEKQVIASQKRKEGLEETKREKEAQERLKQAQVAADLVEEVIGMEHPEEEVEVREAVEEEREPGRGSDNGERSSNEQQCNGIANGGQANGEGGDEAFPLSGSSRQLALKLKSEQKQADEFEKEKKRIEEQQKLQEIRKVKLEAVRERKLQEKKLLEQQKRQEHLEREIEKRVIRTVPLGKDRDHNRYWFFPREGRIFIEDREMSKWGYYYGKEELDALCAALNTKGVRERALQRQLEKHYAKISDALQKRSKDLAQRLALDDMSVRRSSRANKAGSSSQQTAETTYRNKYRNS